MAQRLGNMLTRRVFADSGLRCARIEAPQRIHSARACRTLHASTLQRSDTTTKQDDATSTKESTDEKPIADPIAQELEAKKRDVLDLTDKWKRSIADYRNLQEQTKREIQQAKDFALSRFARDLIESIDNLDRALTTVPSEALESADANKDLKNLHDGLKMTDSILMQTLKKHGLERFDPSIEGDKFDPNRHEATFQAPQEDKVDGTVFMTQQKGFALNGRVLRAAKVGVVRNS